MNNSPTTIVSRPAGGIWGGIGMMLFLFFGFIIGALDSPPKPHEIWIVAIFIAAPGLTALSLLLSVARHRIIADQNGLRWRGAFSVWKSARWDEVSDFRLIGPGNSSHVVETAQGELTFSGNDTHGEELAQFIAAHATRAPCREWLSAHERPGASFEMVFPTPLVSGRALLLAWIPITSAILALMLWLTPRDFALWQSTHETVGWARATWLYLGPLILGAGFLSLIPTVIASQIISARWLGQIERITATERGLHFEKSGQTGEIVWSELRAVHLFDWRALNSRARFETTRGAWELGWRERLRPLIERFAPDVEIHQPEEPPPIRLENGARFYSLRTPNLRLILRVMLAIMALYALMPPLMSVGYTPDDAPPDDLRGVWLLLLVPSGFWIWLWRLYRRGGVAVGESGVEVRGAWRDRFYRWDEIEVDDDDKITARRGEKSLPLWSWSAPIRRDELREEVKRRAAQQ